MTIVFRRERFDPLSKAVIQNADGPNLIVGQVDNGLSVESCPVEVVFRDLDTRLCQEIAKAEAVFGCVAWLTHERVLRVLGAKRAAGIIVQKEDFLRPDSRVLERALTRELYGAIPGFCRYEVRPASGYSACTDPYSEGVRCVGYANLERRRVIPRMHNKFMVFCRKEKWPWTDADGIGPELGSDEYFWEPYAVWTGSFNMTFNASESLENAIIIRHLDIAKAYLEEFGTIFGLSEPLDWSSDWIEPDYRLGT